jgi:hypothetical protein
VGGRDSLSLPTTLALGVAFSGGPIILAKLVTGAMDDANRPRSSVKRFNRLAYVCGVAGIALFAAFGLLRWMAVGSLLVASITTLATVAFALAAAAAWELRGTGGERPSSPGSASPPFPMTPAPPAGSPAGSSPTRSSQARGAPHPRHCAQSTVVAGRKARSPCCG